MSQRGIEREVEREREEVKRERERDREGGGERERGRWREREREPHSLRGLKMAVSWLLTCVKQSATFHPPALFE